MFATLDGKMPHIKTHTKPDLLKELQRHGNIERACRRVGISSQTYRRWVKDQEFSTQAAIALEVGRR